MKLKRSIVLSLLTAAFLLISGCDYRDIGWAPSPQGVYFKIDWSEFPGEELPTGVTIYCYPKNGKMPYTYKSNDIELIRAEMPPGTYDILTFNQVEDEFESFVFSGMEKFSSATVTIREGTKPSWRLAENQPVLCAPEWLTVDRISDYELTEKMLEGNEASYIYLKPHNVIYTATATFKVYRSNKIYKTYGEMTGLASSLMLGSGKKQGPASIQLFEDFAVFPYNDEVEIGEAMVKFHTFGIPDRDTTADAGVPEDNLLHYRFFLVDMSTYNNFVFKVGDRVEVTDSTMNITVEVGHGSEIPQESSWNADPDRPGILPNVKPVTPGAGFDAKIGGWGNEVIIDL